MLLRKLLALVTDFLVSYDLSAPRKPQGCYICSAGTVEKDCPKETPEFSVGPLFTHWNRQIFPWPSREPQKPTRGQQMAMVLAAEVVFLRKVRRELERFVTALSQKDGLLGRWSIRLG